MKKNKTYLQENSTDIFLKVIRGPGFIRQRAPYQNILLRESENNHADELNANNEEILFLNNEIESINSALRRSKEKLGTAKNELNTVNDELDKRNYELEVSQRELKKVNEQLEQFAFISNHDLQEPLRKIETFSGLLASSEADLNDYAKKYSGKINSSVSRMSALIKDLLSFSLVKSDDRKWINVDLNKTVKNVCENFAVIIAEKKANINAMPLPSIKADPAQMNQLFHNLLSNALNFAREIPVINISSRDVVADDFLKYPELIQDMNYVCINMRDTGIGFEQKYVSKIFVLFQRLNDLKRVEGTGTGLAICKKIVEDHRGFIYAKGEENQGATFTIFLPRNIDQFIMG